MTNTKLYLSNIIIFFESQKFKSPYYALKIKNIVHLTLIFQYHKSNQWFSNPLALYVQGLRRCTLVSQWSGLPLSFHSIQQRLITNMAQFTISEISIIFSFLFFFFHKKKIAQQPFNNLINYFIATSKTKINHYKYSPNQKIYIKAFTKNITFLIFSSM